MDAKRPYECHDFLQAFKPKKKNLKSHKSAPVKISVFSVKSVKTLKFHVNTTCNHSTHINAPIVMNRFLTTLTFKKNYSSKHLMITYDFCDLVCDAIFSRDTCIQNIKR